MEPFEFTNIDHDYRSNFANMVCNLLIETHQGNLEDVLLDQKLEDLYNHFRDNVGNIYELIDSEIPLFSLYELNKEIKDKGVDNWGFTEEEFDQSILRSKIASIELYRKRI